MTDQSSDADLVDRLGRRRARMLPVLGMFFLFQQFAFFTNPPAERGVDHVRIGAWVLMTAVILFVLNSGGFWFRPARVRAMLDDEITRANRASAMHWGFLAAILAGVVIYVLLWIFVPLEKLALPAPNVIVTPPPPASPPPTQG